MAEQGGEGETTGTGGTRAQEAATSEGRRLGVAHAQVRGVGVVEVGHCHLPHARLKSGVSIIRVVRLICCRSLQAVESARWDRSQDSR